MKVILLQDVAKIGRRYTVVDVPHGYAMNKLIPQGSAKEATKENIKELKTRTEKAALANAALDQSFQEAVSKIKDVEIKIEVDASENGHLFEALKPERIAESLMAEGISIPRESIHIDKPIKSIGTHTVDLISGTQREKLTFEVVSK
ncbi:MAG: 50S ribosomal protein L9 [Candidatus Paceibacterota bacterium]